MMLRIDIHRLGAILWSLRSYHILLFLAMFSHYSSFIPRTCIVRLGDICNAMRYSNQYSNVGLTIVVKVCCFTFWVHPCIFRLIKPSVLLALLVMLLMCAFQVRSLLMVTPRYLLSSTTSNMWFSVDGIILFDGFAFCTSSYDKTFICIKSHLTFAFPLL